MLDISWNEKSLSNFEKKMDKLIKGLPEVAKKGIESSLKNTQKVALDNKRGNKDKNLIPVEIMDFDKMKVVGRVYTDSKLFSYAPFLEFGTGTKAELEHIGKTATFIASGYRYWFMPIDTVDRPLNNPIWEPKKGHPLYGTGPYYIMFATKPYPFMRPTAFSTRKENVEILKKAIQVWLKEVL